MEVRFLTFSDFTPLMLTIGGIVFLLQLIASFKSKKTIVSSIPLCLLIIGLAISSLAPVLNIGSTTFQSTMSNLMYYFCISSIGDIVAWLTYYIYSLLAHNY